MVGLNTLALLLFSVSIAAAIGGMTNYLAIRMLFRPKREIVLWGRKLPFTPGLIPKRRTEIAESLGEVVEQYLVTSDGLRRVLNDPEFQSRLRTKLISTVEAWSEREETLSEWMNRVWGAAETERKMQQLTQTLKDITRSGVSWLWEDQKWKERTLGELIPGWSQETKQKTVQSVTDYIVTALQEELRTAQADRLIRKMAAQFMEQAGGFIGTLAGIFMDEEKVSRTIRRLAVEKLDSPIVRGYIDTFLEKKVTEWEHIPLEVWIDRLSGESSAVEWLVRMGGSVLKAETWLHRGLDMTFRDVLGGGRGQWIIDRIPSIVEWSLATVSDQVERIVAAINLQKLVREQVADFPIERLERIVLSVSGKEFRAITWLGALLGGLIGLLQFIILRLVA